MEETEVRKQPLKSTDKEDKSKVISIRTSEKAAASFKDYCEEAGLTQEKAFTMVMELAEKEKSKVKFPESAQAIETFEKAEKLLSSLFITALEEAKQAESLSNSRVSEQMRSKDMLINDLQRKLNTAREDRSLAIDSETRAKKEYNTIKQQFDDLKERFDSETFNNNAKLKELQRENRDLKDELADKSASFKKYDELEDKYKELLKEHEKMMASHEAEIEKLKAECKEQVLETEKEAVKNYQSLYSEVIRVSAKKM